MRAARLTLARIELERHRLSPPLRHQKLDAGVAASSKGEGDRRCRRGVQPLHVVDGEQHRLSRGEQSEQAEQRGGGGTLTQAWPSRLVNEQRRPQCFPLWHGQAAELVGHGREQIGQRGEREATFDRRRLGPQDEEVLRAHAVEDSAPERRLPNSRVAFDDKRGRTFLDAFEEALDLRELLVTADELRAARCSCHLRFTLA